MRPIEISAHEQGTTRLFSLSMDAPSARRVRDDVKLQAALLGVTQVRASGVEVFRVVDLDELGLAGYLRDGIDAQEADLTRDGAKLAALDGWVMLVHSSAFSGERVAIVPAPELTLIGTYSQQTTAAAPVEIVSEAAQPYTGVAKDNPIAAPKTRRAGSLVVAVLIVVATLLLWWALA
jgi:hypothetical protein